ncbi:MAG: hypothetical protein GY906_11485 [bacterium]|nr:hypothetical protein [bacterium]
MKQTPVEYVPLDPCEGDIRFMDIWRACQLAMSGQGDDQLAYYDPGVRRTLKRLSDFRDDQGTSLVALDEDGNPILFGKPVLEGPAIPPAKGEPRCEGEV